MLKFESKILTMTYIKQCGYKKRFFNEEIRTSKGDRTTSRARLKKAEETGRTVRMGHPSYKAFPAESDHEKMECLDETGGMIEKTNMKANN